MADPVSLTALGLTAFSTLFSIGAQSQSAQVQEAIYRYNAKVAPLNAEAARNVAQVNAAAFREDASTVRGTAYENFQAALSNARSITALAEYNAAVLKADAEAIREKTAEEVQLLRDEGQSLLGSQEAGYAASGVLTASGSAETVRRRTQYNLDYQEMILKKAGETEARQRLSTAQGTLMEANALAERYHRAAEIEFDSAMAQAEQLERQAEIAEYIGEIQAWSYENQTGLQNMMASSAVQAGNVQAVSTLLTGATSIALHWPDDWSFGSSESGWLEA